MTYNAFAHLSPLSDTYELKDNFNSESDTESPETSFDSDNPFAHLSPLSDTYAIKGDLAPVAQAQPEAVTPVVQPEEVTPVAETPQNPIGQFDLIEVSPDKQGWGELGGWKNLDDGSVSTELTITVKHPELNRGMPTVIPTLVAGQENIDGLLSFNITDQHEEIAVKRAIQRQNDGQQWPAFRTIELANEFAKDRSNSKTDSAIGKSADVATKMLFRGLQSLAELGDSEPLAEWAAGIVAKQDRDIEEGGYQSTYTKGSLRETFNEDGIGDALGYIGESILENSVASGAAVGGTAVAAVATALSAPAWLIMGIGTTTVAASGIMGGGETALEMEDKGVEVDNRLVAGTMVIIGFLDGFGAGKLIPKGQLASMSGETIIKRLVSAEFYQAAKEFTKVFAKKVAAETGAEVAQESVIMGAAAIQGAKYDPLEVLDRLIDTAFVSAGMSGPISVASTVTDVKAANNLAQSIDSFGNEMVNNGGGNNDGGPQRNSDGSFGTPNPALSDPNAIAVTGDGTVVYKEGTAPDATGTTPDLPTSEAPDIAEVEVGINAQRAELDDDLAKALASLDKPLMSSVPPTVELLPPPTIVSAPKDESEVDPLAITAEDMAQIDIDTAAYEASIAATNTELPPTLPALTPETVELLPESPALTPETVELAPETVELAPETVELPPESPVVTVEPPKKLLSESQKAAKRKEIDPTKDDLLVAIAKEGGVTRAEASSEGFDTPDFKLRKGFGQVVFRAKAEEGMSFDAMRETLSQYGYIDPDSTVNDFADLLQKAIRGETVVSTANETYLADVDAAREDDYLQQGGIIDEAPAPVKPQDQNITSALEEARTLGLPESEIDSILTNYPKESEAVLQLQMSMGDIELGDSSVTTNQAARVGDLRPERDVSQSGGNQGLAGQYTNDGTGPSDNGTQNGTDEVGVLLSPSATSGDPIADSEAGSGGGSDSAGLSGTNAGETVPLDGTMLPTERSRIETKLSAMSTKDFATTLKKTGLLKTGTKESKIKRMVDAREGAQAMAQFDSLEAFIEAVNDTPKWQDALSKTTISKSDLLRWTNATKMKGDLYSREGVLENAANLYDWATASGALNIPRTSEKSQYEGESSMQASERAADERIKASKKATESYSNFSRLEDPSLTQEQIQTNYEAMVAGEDKRIVQAEKDSKALESVDTETQTEETSVDFLQTVRMGLMNKMKAPQAKFYLKRGSFPEPSAARMDELITKAGYMGASSQGPDFALISATSPSYQALGIEEYTESEQIWVQVKLLADKKLRYRGDFLYPTDSFIEEVANNKANLETQTEESFDLEAQTEESLAADTELATTAATEQAAKTKTLLNRAKADAEVGSFLLTGSDAPADVAVANGQDDMFDADPNGTGQDSGKPLFSKSAILDPDVKPKGVTEAQIQARVDVFLAKYKGADDVRVWVRDTQDNAFGPGSTAKDGRIKGGYYPEQDAVVFIAENIDSVQDIDSTIQHELLVHKGLGLFEAKDVKGLVDVINSNAPKSAALGKIWDEVKVKYKDKSPEVQAEELIAKVAEKKMSKPDKYWNKIITFIRNMLRKIGFVKEISFSDLRKRVYDMGEAFAEGRRAETREGYESNTDTKSPSSDGLSGSKRFDSKKDKDTVRPNPSMIDMSKRSDKKVTSKTSDALPFITNDKNVTAKIPKVEKGNGKPDLTIYGVNNKGQRVLVAKPRAGGWDIVVDRRADGELFSNGKPLEFSGQTIKQVRERVKMLGLELEEVLNKKPPSLPPLEGELLNDQPQWEMQDATSLDKFIFELQDRLIAADKARKAIEKFTGERLADDMRVYEIETLAHGKAAAQLETFYEETLMPLQKLLSKNDLSMNDVSDYLYARHTKEANAAMKAKDGDRTENEALSGKTNEWAAKILSDFKAEGKTDALKQIAQVTDGIIERSRQLLVRTGLESESTVQGWRDQYEYYAPLWGDPSDPEGTQRREEESKKRLGRRSEADNVYINLIVQHEQTIVRAERNYLSRSLLKMAQENPNDDFFTINKPEVVRVQDPVTELFLDREIPPNPNATNIVSVTVDGEKFLIQFNDDTYHSQKFAHVMNTGAGSDITGFIKFAHLSSRWVSSVNTQFNLEFMPSNFIKDFQTAIINLHQYADLSGAQITKIGRNVSASIKGIRANQKGDKEGEMALWYERFKNAGSQTGWLDNYDSMTERGKALQTMINRDKNVSLDAAHRLIEYVSDMNTAVENGMRLSAFKLLIEELGFTDQRAAFAVKNLTVNFNQKGEKSITANALYVFFKSSMNGTRNIAQAVKSNRVRKVLYKMLGFVIGVGILNRFLGGEDEDGQSVYSKIPLYIRDNHYIFMLPEFGEDDASERLFISISTSYGYNVVPVAGNIIGDKISTLLGGQDYRKEDSLSRMVGGFVHGFNPMGSTGGLAQFIAPTIVDPIAEIVENKNFAGNPVAPEQMPFGPKVPNAQLSFKRTPEFLKYTASFLNDISGGDEVRPGLVNLSPEWLEIYWGFLAGGAGRFMGDLVGTPVKMVLGEEWSVRDIPFVRKVIKKVGNSTDQNNFYSALDDIEYAMRDKKAAKESGDDERIDQVDADYGHLIDLEKSAKSSRKSVSEWRGEIKLVEDGDEDNEYKQFIIEKLNKEIRSEMMMFVREYYDAVELAEDY